MYVYMYNIHILWLTQSIWPSSQDSVTAVDFGAGGRGVDIKIDVNGRYSDYEVEELDVPNSDAAATYKPGRAAKATGIFLLYITNTIYIYIYVYICIYIIDTYRYIYKYSICCAGCVGSSRTAPIVTRGGQVLISLLLIAEILSFFLVWKRRGLLRVLDEQRAAVLDAVGFRIGLKRCVG